MKQSLKFMEYYSNSLLVDVLMPSYFQVTTENWQILFIDCQHYGIHSRGHQGTLHQHESGTINTWISQNFARQDSVIIILKVNDL